MVFLILLVLLMNSMLIAVKGFNHVWALFLTGPKLDYEVLSSPERIRTESKQIEIHDKEEKRLINEIEKLQLKIDTSNSSNTD